LPHLGVEVISYYYDQWYKNLDLFLFFKYDSFSKKLTSLEMKTFLFMGSKHLHPFEINEYPRKIVLVEIKYNLLFHLILTNATQPDILKCSILIVR
jgi:hypothetical protein